MSTVSIRSCSHCGADARSYLRTRDLNQKVSREWFEYFRCERCALIFLAPIPHDLERYYPDGYYLIPESVSQLAAWAERERYKLEIVQRFSQGERLLELGPAWGSFALLAKRAGFKVQVIEMSQACCEFLSRKVGIEVVSGADEIDALQRAQDADVITLWQVIEHLRDPWAVLRAAAAKLRAGGVLVIASPNPEALQLRLLGRYWLHIDAPRHLYLIPRALLVADALALGLVPVLETTTDKGSLGFNLIGWVGMANRLNHRVVRFVARVIGRAIAALLWPVESVEGRGSTYTLLLRRKNRT